LAQFLGMFHSDAPYVLQGVYDAPYRMCARHALCGRGAAEAEGAAALAVGWMRNVPEIRRELRACGRNLRGDESASMLLLYAYRQWGEQCVEKIEGPVICVVIDREKGRLLLSTDRMGEAGSVFYSVQGEQVVFAGHPEPLFGVRGVSRCVDEDGWREIFGLGPASTQGKTPFRDIRCLPCGYVLTADRQGQYMRRYFKLKTREHTEGERETTEHVRALLERAVDDVMHFKPAAMLSGGLDSTALCALMSRRSTEPIHTFSVDYEGSGEYFRGNEYQIERDAPYAQMAVQALGCRHTRIALGTEELLGTLDEAMAARGRPGMADIDSSLLAFSRRIAREARYVVSGECGDEVFGGYPWFHREELIERDCFPWSGSLELRERILRKDVAKKLRLEEYVRERWREAMGHQVVLDGESEREKRLRRLQGVCFEYFMANLQERASAMGTAAGLTVLTPLCDERLAEYVYNVPWKLKNLGGTEKGLFREAMKGIVPEGILHRKKSPYPKTHHPAYTEGVRRRMAEILEDRNSPILALIDRQAVERLMCGDMSPAATPWFGQLMTGPQMLAYLIQVNDWMKRYAVEPV